MVSTTTKASVKPGDTVRVSSVPSFDCIVVAVHKDGSVTVKPCDSVRIRVAKDDDPHGWGGWDAV